MPLEAGTTLGHYEVLSSLGAGGMGEVHLAVATTYELEETTRKPLILDQTLPCEDIP